MFSSEKELHELIQGFLSENLSDRGNIFVESEMKGLFGVPDLVLAENVDGKVHHVIAIELKLSSWKRALMQAFRYRSFAWESYVVLDEKRSSPALSNVATFKKHNIGLATYSQDGFFKIIFKPKIKEPYSTKLFQKICSTFSHENDDSTCSMTTPSRKIGLGRAFQELAC